MHRAAWLLLVVACDPAEAPPALRVGPHAFTREEVAARRRIVLLRHPGSDRAAVGAYAQLIEGYLLTEVLAALGRPITEKELSEEVARINRESQDVEGLRELKQICGGEQSPRYRRIALQPDYANRRFFLDLYPHDETLHREALQRAKDALSQLRSGASRTDGEQQALTFSVGKGFEPATPVAPPPGSPASAANPVWKQYEDELFATTPRDEWIDRVINLPEGFVLLRWTGWEDEPRRVRRIEQRRFSKADAGEFYWRKAASIPVWIADARIREEVRRAIPWASKVSWSEK